MNLFIFTGNLGKDAEIKTTSTGTQVMTFSVAVKSGYGDNAKTNWINCAMFGKRTEGQLINYLKKGTQVAISGEYELKEWQGQDGTQNKMPSVRVNELDLIGGKSDSAPQQQQSGFGQNLSSGEASPAPSQHPHSPERGAHMKPKEPGYHGGQPVQQPDPQNQPGGFDDFDDDIPL